MMATVGIAAGLATLTAPAMPASPLGYVCYRAATPPKIDGRLDEAAWRDAPWTTDFVDIEGDARPRPGLRTRAKMLWDDEYFYVGAELEEPHLWATLTKHDSVIFQDHDFEVFIDPNGDSHEYYEFEINALGTGWDLFLPRPYKDGGQAMNGWEIPGMGSAVHLDGTLDDPADTDRGWTVELAFPWAALKEQARRPAPPADGDQWRLDFSRVEWDLTSAGGRYAKVPGAREHNWVWSPQGVINMHRPESWGYVQFSTGPPGSASFRPDPALPARRWLHAVYYAQREYRKAHARWARALNELGVAPPSEDALGHWTLEVTASLFEAAVDLRVAGGQTQRWHIRQDALVWVE
jgi:Carbohydrate family 9 binding domain-like